MSPTAKQPIARQSQNKHDDLSHDSQTASGPAVISRICHKMLNTKHSTLYFSWNLLAPLRKIGGKRREKQAMTSRSAICLAHTPDIVEERPQTCCFHISKAGDCFGLRNTLSVPEFKVWKIEFCLAWIHCFENGIIVSLCVCVPCKPPCSRLFWLQSNKKQQRHSSAPTATVLNGKHMYMCITYFSRRYTLRYWDIPISELRLTVCTHWVRDCAKADPRKRNLVPWQRWSADPNPNPNIFWIQRTCPNSSGSTSVVQRHPTLSNMAQCPARNQSQTGALLRGS